MINNALVYAAADKYAIEPLKTLAKERFHELAKSAWLSLSSLTSIAREVFSTTPASDGGLRKIVVSRCMANLDVLLKDEGFKELLEEDGSLGSSLLQAQHEKQISTDQIVQSLVSTQLQTNQTLNTQLAEARANTEAANQARNAIQETMDTRMEILGSWDGCRQCGTDFGAELREGEKCVRCWECGTKHW